MLISTRQPNQSNQKQITRLPKQLINKPKINNQPNPLNNFYLKNSCRTCAGNSIKNKTITYFYFLQFNNLINKHSRFFNQSFLFFNRKSIKNRFGFALFNLINKRRNKLTNRCLTFIN